VVATAERTQTQPGRKLETATADPAPPTRGADGDPVRLWDVDGETREFSLKPYPESERPRYWYTGTGAKLRIKAQRINDFGIQPVVLNDCFVDGSFRPRNAWEEHVTRAFLRRKHIDPDKSRDERHPAGPDAMWRCGEPGCNFVCPSWHVFQAHQRTLIHTTMLAE
jgi:hypothetical protein